MLTKKKLITLAIILFILYGVLSIAKSFITQSRMYQAGYGTVYTLATVYRGYNTYIDPNECQRILHAALYTRVPYSDFAYRSYMSEQAYNAISILTKTHYKELTQSVLGIAIVNQVLDADDPSILYLDYFLYRKRPGESIYDVTPNQLVIKYSPSSWKILTSIDPIKPDWYDDYLNGSSWLMWK